MSPKEQKSQSHVERAAAFLGTGTTFQLSWLGGTFVGYIAGFRKPHNLVYVYKGLKLYLGSMLLGGEESTSRVYPQFLFSTFRRNVVAHPTPLLIIQVLEAAELETNIPGAELSATKQGEVDDQTTIISFALRDFSHAPVAPPKIIANVTNIINTHINPKLDQGQELTTYVHCKAGVNRSFRVVSAIKAILELQQLSDPLTAEIVAQKVWDICVDIKTKRRTCVDFTEQNCLIQASFICSIVGAYFDVAPSNDTNFLPELLKIHVTQLIADRQEEPATYTSTAASIIPAVMLWAAVPREVKLAALQKFLADLKEDECEGYTADEIAALQNGVTQHVFATASEHHCLPPCLQSTLATTKTPIACET